MPLRCMHVYIHGKSTLTGMKGQKGQELAPTSDGRDSDVAA